MWSVLTELYSLELKRKEKCYTQGDNIIKEFVELDLNSLKEFDSLFTGSRNRQM